MERPAKLARLAEAAVVHENGRPSDVSAASPAAEAAAPQKRLMMGVDGGGTKTAVAVLDVDTDELVARSATGCSNW